MAREQGDELGDEVAYIHPDHPEYGERAAYTPTDVVNLEARGWEPKQSTGRTGGSRRRSAPTQDEGGSDAAPTASS